MKGDVGKVVCTRGRKELNTGLIEEDGVFLKKFTNFVYVALKWFYNSFYYYFFTFSVISLPLTQVLIVKEMAQ